MQAGMPDAFSQCPPLYSQPEGSAVIIDYQYYAIEVIPRPVQALVVSSNQTLAPFSAPTIPIEELFLNVSKPVLNKTCDQFGRCIEAYELAAEYFKTQLGFYDVETGEPIGTTFLTYNDVATGVLSPFIVAEQGVQSLVRVHNW